MDRGPAAIAEIWLRLEPVLYSASAMSTEQIDHAALWERGTMIQSNHNSDPGGFRPHLLRAFEVQNAPPPLFFATSTPLGLSPSRFGPCAQVTHADVLASARRV